MSNETETVSITYSAGEQKELNAIRARYTPKEGRSLTDLDKVKAIDARAKRKGRTAGLTVGILGTLITGLGMSFVMVWDMLAPGIVIGLVGLAGVAGAYPLYQRVIRKERVRAADEITRLSSE